MIPYDDLVAALNSWRARQGLPVTATAVPGSGPTPTAIPNTGSGGYANTGSGGYANTGSGSYASPGSGGYASGGSGSYASPGSGGYASGGSGSYASPGSGATAMPGSGPVRGGPPSAPPRGGYQPPPLATPDPDTNDEAYDVEDAALLEEAQYENEGADYGVSLGAVERDEESTTLGQAPSERDSFGGETDYDPGAGSNKTRKPW